MIFFFVILILLKFFLSPSLICFIMLEGKNDTIYRVHDGKIVKRFTLKVCDFSLYEDRFSVIGFKCPEKLYTHVCSIEILLFSFVLCQEKTSF